MNTKELYYLVSILLDSLKGAEEELSIDIGIALSILQHELIKRGELVKED